MGEYFNVTCIKKKNGEVLPVIGLDLAEKIQRYAEKRKIPYIVALQEYQRINPEAYKKYELEKKEFYDSEPADDVAETDDTDEGAIVEDELETDRIIDEVNALDERLHSDLPDEEEKEAIRARLIELRTILIQRGVGY